MSFGPMMNFLKPNHQPGQPSTRPTINQANNQQDTYWNTAIKGHHVRISKYRERGKKVAPILKIFESWFVIQWIIYYVASVLDLAHNIRPWMGDKDESIDDFTRAYNILYLIYVVLAFVIPHVCGLRMNVYHREYHKKITKEQEQIIEELTQRNNAQGNRVDIVYMYSALLSHQLHIKKQKSYDFVPYISWLGIDISVDGPGYVLTMLLTFFSFVGAYSL